jgi:outer membrane protein assembly factor BamB
MTARPTFIALCVLAVLSAPLPAENWTHWRGPNQNGVIKGQNLPETFELTSPGKNGLLWKVPLGGRSAPIVLNGKLYFMNGYDAGKLTEGERVVCLDAETGKTEWEYRFGVFHTDIVSSRLGWTSMTADVEKGVVYAHTTAGHLLALNAKDGKLLWQRQLTEEFGRVTGYGGRISSPIFDSGLVMVGIVTGGWVDQSRGNNRFYAFDAATGNLVWVTSPTEELNQSNITLNGTYYSNPVIAVINGQRLMISGAADGCIHALKVRTGERVWSHFFSTGVVNPSPVVEGNNVYVCHGEENPGGGTIGRLTCLDASKIKDKEPTIVWDKRISRRFGLASPALADGKLYVPEDGGELYCFAAKTGKQLWKYKYGTVSRGAPLVVDGQLFIFDVFGKLTVITKLGDEEPDSDDDVREYRFRPRLAGALLETNGTPVAINGRLYFQTLDDTYCVGAAQGSPTPAQPTLPPETPFDPNAEPSGLIIYPAEATTMPTGVVNFEARFVDANGRLLPTPTDAAIEWSLPQPPLPPTAPKGATPPPALKASLKPEGAKVAITIDKAPPAQHGVVLAKAGKLTAKARVRVVATLPYKQEFTNIPVGAPPGGWINAAAKYSVAEIMVEGKPEKVLSKVNNSARPPIARANTYITLPDSTGYTIESDVYATEAHGKLPEMGVVANRYLLVLDGKPDDESKKRLLRLISWEARNRVNKVIPFDWKPDTWYRMKLTIEFAKGEAVLRGKVWERSTPEPKDWTIEFVDPNPNLTGAAALYGYVPNVIQAEGSVLPGSNIYYDNLLIAPTKK